MIVRRILISMKMKLNMYTRLGAKKIKLLSK